VVAEIVAGERRVRGSRQHVDGAGCLAGEPPGLLDLLHLVVAGADREPIGVELEGVAAVACRGRARDDSPSVEQPYGPACKARLAGIAFTVAVQILVLDSGDLRDRAG